MTEKTKDRIMSCFYSLKTFCIVYKKSKIQLTKSKFLILQFKGKLKTTDKKWENPEGTTSK